MSVSTEMQHSAPEGQHAIDWTRLSCHGFRVIRTKTRIPFDSQMCYRFRLVSCRRNSWHEFLG